MRVVLADDSVLLREGAARLLTEAGLEVVAQAGDADELLALVDQLHPDVAVVPDGFDEIAAFGVSRHDGRSVTAAFEQATAVDKRDVPILQFLVVASKASLRQDRCDAFIKKFCSIFGAGSAGEQKRNDD